MFKRGPKDIYIAWIFSAKQTWRWDMVENQTPCCSNWNQAVAQIQRQRQNCSERYHQFHLSTYGLKSHGRTVSHAKQMYWNCFVFPVAERVFTELDAEIGDGPALLSSGVAINVLSLLLRLFPSNKIHLPTFRAAFFSQTSGGSFQFDVLYQTQICR